MSQMLLELGGLGLHTPFISFLVVKKRLPGDPESRMFQFVKQGREDYRLAKKTFDTLFERHGSCRVDAFLDRQPSDLYSQGFIPVSVAFNSNGSKRGDDGNIGTKPS